VRQLIDASGKDIRLEIDGGVKIDNIREVASAGADTFVAHFFHGCFCHIISPGLLKRPLVFSFHNFY
jgi:hypothetical protein